MTRDRTLRRASRPRLALRVMIAFVRVCLTVRRTPLPEAVTRLAGSTRPQLAAHPESPARLSGAIHRTLRLGKRRPRCLHSALVLLSLLRAQDQPAVLVVGLPPRAASNRAHAWVELAGRDVGPPPGRSGHQAMVRYPLDQGELDSPQDHQQLARGSDAALH